LDYMINVTWALKPCWY